MTERPAANIDRIERGLRGGERWGLLCGVVAGAVCAIAAIFWTDAVARAYLPAFLFVWGLSIGCLGLALIDTLTGGHWGEAGRPFLRAGTALVPATAILFLPVAFAVPRLYPWAEPGFWAGYDRISHRAEYFVPWFFWLRSAGYFLLWSVMAVRVAWNPRGRVSLAGPGLVALVLSVTWAGMDWVMSLDPWLASTLFGALVGMGAHLTAIALVCGAVALAPAVLPADAPTKSIADLGNLLLAFVMLWTYFAFSHFLIIWSGNLPDEAAWYVRRSTGGWQWIAWLIFLGGFAGPFAALLSRDWKRKPAGLGAIAAVVLFTHYLALCWDVLPEFSPGRFHLNPFAFVTPVAAGGLWLAAYCRLLRRDVPAAIVQAEPKEVRS